ncbi:hypothetical protein EGN72_05590 [Pseudorhodobacter sp. E13]|uniref:hypothetical protein n=1 Tax=Pseudorhodobacter sp. E13 TaxID=2487931 RepID=UPI000F8CCEF4|nr:hypothetical protein [Pseudorhodobacter sp. E13]RUS63142.1 hypothetical protein EGN72_05590 [Pseudorhodobacter sp. E13]
MIFEVLAEVAQAILQAFLELVIRLLALVLRSSYLIEHTRGISRHAHAIALTCGGYLSFGILRALFDGMATPVLQPLYAWPLVVAALVLLLVALAVPEAVRETASPARKAARKEEPAMLWPLAVMLSLALILGVVSLWQGEVHRKTLAERACDAANTRISPELRDTAEKGLALADRLLKREAPSVLPCTEAQ